MAEQNKAEKNFLEALSIVSVAVMISLSIAMLVIVVFLENIGLVWPSSSFFFTFAVMLSASLVICYARMLRRTHPKLFIVILAVLIGVVVIAFTWFYITRPSVSLISIIVAVILSVPLLTLALVRRSKTAFVLYVVSLCAIIVLWKVPCSSGHSSSRHQFLKDLERIRAGMTLPEVDEVMSGHIKGVSEKWPPFMGKADTLKETTDKNGNLTYEGSLIYRHSDEAAFDSDWGIVKFRNGRVVDVEFAPD